MFLCECNNIEKIKSCNDFMKRQEMNDRSIMLLEQVKSLLSNQPNQINILDVNHLKNKTGIKDPSEQRFVKYV